MRAPASFFTLALVTLGISCSQDRSFPATPPVYDADVAPLLESRCSGCHAGASAEAGWSATSYLGVIGCVAPSGAPATLPSGPEAPMLRTLDDERHRGLLDAAERELLEAWISAGAPAFRSTVHPARIADPRSSDFHATALRRSKWAPMLDPLDPGACGRCHDGVPVRPGGVTSSAPGAPSCTSCHDQPAGVLACGTCHGDGARPYPPRDPCFFPGEGAKAGAHEAHMQTASITAYPLSCATCHPMPGFPVVGGVHGDGKVDVIFDAARVPGGSFDAASGTCTVDCHDQGGARSRPAWTDTAPMGCNDCHGAPPARHYPGSCTTCHREADATGTSLGNVAMHMNGRVDLGDGSGTCAACHGASGDPWPKSDAHASHESPSLTSPIDCGSCHPVPDAVLAPGHLDGTVQIAFSGRAVDRGVAPTWDGRTCASVACHGAGLTEPPAVVPVWTDPSGAAGRCGACHGIPPQQHTPSTSCDRSTCHGSEVWVDASGKPSITQSGKTLHVNGVIDYVH